MNDRPAPESPEAWLQRARSDLALARTVVDSGEVLREDVCFHAQQCAEKALKALLIRLEIPYQRTHALEMLLDLVKAAGVKIPQDVDLSFSLTQYAVETGYPNDWEPITEEETRSAIEMAVTVLRWLEGQLGE
jgi:HEPN domain-containing protein